MRVLAVFVLASSLFASQAFAITADLRLAACAGDPAAVTAADVDCAGTSSLVLYGTFEPNVAIPDLVALDSGLELTVEGRTFEVAPFWSFDAFVLPCAGTPGSQRRVLGVDPQPPASGCGDYTPTWDTDGAGTAVSASSVSSNSLHMSMTCYRPTVLAVAESQKLFGFQLVIDLVNATERGGHCPGCTAAVRIDWSSASALSDSGQNDDTSSGGSPLSSVLLNPGAVPTRAHTWGQLKSLYR